MPFASASFSLAPLVLRWMRVRVPNSWTHLSPAIGTAQTVHQTHNIDKEGAAAGSQLSPGLSIQRRMEVFHSKNPGFAFRSCKVASASPITEDTPEQSLPFRMVVVIVVVVMMIGSVTPKNPKLQ